MTFWVRGKHRTGVPTSVMIFRLLPVLRTRSAALITSSPFLSTCWRRFSGMWMPCGKSKGRRHEARQVYAEQKHTSPHARQGGDDSAPRHSGFWGNGSGHHHHSGGSAEVSESADGSVDDWASRT